MTTPRRPIRRQIMAVVMLTCIAVLALTVTAFATYNLMAERHNMVRDFTTLAQVIADDSTAAFAFGNEKDGRERLSPLRNEPQVTAAALYDNHGKMFAGYPDAETSALALPPADRPGYRFEHGHLVVCEPVYQGSTRLGTLCLAADLRLFYQHLEIYSALSALIILASLIATVAIAHRLQRRISDPIVALADTARIISERRDFSVRARKVSGDELGLLTDAFNQMLTRIEEQTVALRENEEHLALALQAGDIGTWDWNLATGRVLWDAQLYRLFGREPAEFDGTYQSFITAVHPADRRTVEEHLERSLKSQKDFTVEFRAISGDGTIHDLLTRGRAIYGPNGKPLRMNGVTLDITERRRSEEASRHLAAIVESSDDAIISKELTHSIITSWNLGAQRIFGYTAEEVLGRPITITMPPERHKEEPEILGRLRRGERIEHYETVRQRKDGTWFNVSLTVSPIKNAAGEIVGASQIARDITERIHQRESLESHARMLREQAQMLDLANVMARDLEDRIILWNTGMEKMYGWLRTEALGRKSHEILRTRFPVPLAEIKAALMRDGRWEGEVVHTRKDGRVVTVASQWVLHRDDQGRPVAILEVNSDITDRKLAEQQMLRLNAELERRVAERTAALTVANQELEAFTYSVAHDLRAPLRHIDAFTKIIFDDFFDQIPPEARRYLESIRKGSQNMSRLVDDLLNLARVGRQELKRERMPLRPLVEEVIADLKGEMERRRIDWTVGNLPVVEGDPGLMKQVFANLLSNAVKYTRPRKQAVVEIGQRQFNGQTAVYVRDNGVGFNMKYADKLFGVFQRLHRADEFEGTGVGLATVDRIIRKHGGRIWAESEVERGATFYFTVDALNPPADTAPESTS